MEIWSLTRFPEGERAGEAHAARAVGVRRSRGGRRSPPRTSRTCRRQQRGLHARGFEYMRLSERIEGGIANFERTVDGFLAGLPYEKLLPALQAVNVNPLERPVVDLGF